MILGGVPFYLEKLNREKSIAQNIDAIFFNESAELKNEFNNLVNSLFKNSEKYKKVLQALSNTDKAQTRNEISFSAKISNGGGLTDRLVELELSDFITKSYPIGGNVNNKVYQISDPYLLFYFRFMHEKKQLKANYWINLQDSPEYRQWSGIAYEKLCFKHINQISRSLGISGIQTTETSWRDDNKKPTVQIDLVIERKDQVINLCEVKFTEGVYTIDKKYAEVLRKKIRAFKEKTNTKKAIFPTLITTYPLQENAYSREIIVNKINMNDLFENIF